MDLQQHGYTDGCPGCDAAANGAKAVGHSNACRQRIEAKMHGDEAAAAKLLRARKRRGQFHGALATAKQAHSAAAAKEEMMLLARAAAAAAAGEESACGDRRRRRHKGP